jgi:hypothetical protein
MAKKSQRRNRLLVGCVLISLCGLPFILFGLHSITWALIEMLQNPGLSINYGPAIWWVVYGGVLVLLGPILFVYKYRD